MPNKSSNGAGPAAHALGATSTGVSRVSVAANMMTAGKGSVPSYVSPLQSAGATHPGGGNLGAAARALGFQATGIARGSTAAGAMATGHGQTPASVSKLQSAGARSSAGPAKK